MELLILGFLALFLLVVVGIALWHRTEVAKKELILLEPLGYLLDDWQLVRVIGDETAVQYIVRLFLETQLQDGSLFEKVICDLKIAKKTPKVTLQKKEKLAVFGEKREFAIQGKTIGAMIGIGSELPKLNTIQIEAQQRLGKQGFLVLTVLENTAPEKKTSYVYVGQLVLEPKVIKPFSSERAVKFATVLPTELATWVFEKTFGSNPKTVSETELNEAEVREWEKLVNASDVIAETSFSTRYRIARYVQHERRYQVISRNDEDKLLPGVS